MDVDENEINSTTYLADLVRCENTRSCITRLMQSENAKDAVDTNLYPIGKLKFINNLKNHKIYQVKLYNLVHHVNP